MGEGGKVQELRELEGQKEGRTEGKEQRGCGSRPWVPVQVETFGINRGFVGRKDGG